MTVICRASALPGHTERLTGEASADDIRKATIVSRLGNRSGAFAIASAVIPAAIAVQLRVVGHISGKRPDVIVNRDIWPVLGKDGSAVGVDFDKLDGSESARSLKPEAEAANPAKTIEHGEDIQTAPSAD